MRTTFTEREHFIEGYYTAQDFQLRIIAVRQYFAIVIILANQNYAIRWNNIAIYAIY